MAAVARGIAKHNDVILLDRIDQFFQEYRQAVIPVEPIAQACQEPMIVGSGDRCVIHASHFLILRQLEIGDHIVKLRVLRRIHHRKVGGSILACQVAKPDVALIQKPHTHGNAVAGSIPASTHYLLQHVDLALAGADRQSREIRIIQHQVRRSDKPRSIPVPAVGMDEVVIVPAQGEAGGHVDGRVIDCCHLPNSVFREAVDKGAAFFLCDDAIQVDELPVVLRTSHRVLDPFVALHGDSAGASIDFSAEIVASVPAVDSLCLIRRGKNRYTADRSIRIHRLDMELIQTPDHNLPGMPVVLAVPLSGNLREIDPAALVVTGCLCERKRPFGIVAYVA